MPRTVAVDVDRSSETISRTSKWKLGFRAGKGLGYEGEEETILLEPMLLPH